MTELFDPCEHGIRSLQSLMQSGDITSEQLSQSYLDRIAAFDQAGPCLNAVLYHNPNALDTARALDAERARGVVRGPLHGIPILLKDNYDTKDMPTTGASLALSGLVPAEDAFQVRKLREAGVVLLGKVNLHELALGLTTVSSLGGQTLNPYDLDRVPGGSSGGSAVATAASFAAFTMGTDTSGSIRVPSSHNSIVGLRPSAGLSSRSGIIPFGNTQDTGGPMARTVEDVAIVLDATVGYDPKDPVTAASKGKIPATYTAFLNANALQGVRIGVLKQLFGDGPEDEEVSQVVRQALQDMKELSATLVEIAIPDLTEQLQASYLMSQELKFCLREYLGRAHGSPVKSLEELLSSGLHTAQFQAFAESANERPEDYLTSVDYTARREARARLRQTILTLMDTNRLDAIAYPVIRRIAPKVGGTQTGSNAAVSAQTGLPAIAVPAGFTAGGFPVGVELLGRPFGEPTLLGLSYAYEQSTRHRRPPSVTPPLTTRSAVAPCTQSASDTGPGSVGTLVAATGSQSVPPSHVQFEALAQFSFNGHSRELGYSVAVAGASADEVAGIFLHQRANRPNGGVAYVLSKSGRSPISGKVTLLEKEAEDLRDGKFYLSVISRGNPLLSARADIVLPESGGAPEGGALRSKSGEQETTK